MSNPYHCCCSRFIVEIPHQYAGIFPNRLGMPVYTLPEKSRSKGPEAGRTRRTQPTAVVHTRQGWLLPGLGSGNQQSSNKTKYNFDLVMVGHVQNFVNSASEILSCRFPRRDCGGKHAPHCCCYKLIPGPSQASVDGHRIKRIRLPHF